MYNSQCGSYQRVSVITSVQQHGLQSALISHTCANGHVTLQSTFLFHVNSANTLHCMMSTTPSVTALDQITAHPRRFIAGFTDRVVAPIYTLLDKKGTSCGTDGTSTDLVRCFIHKHKLGPTLLPRAHTVACSSWQHKMFLTSLN